jgi:hypothetical protein
MSHALPLWPPTLDGAIRSDSSGDGQFCARRLRERRKDDGSTETVIQHHLGVDFEARPGQPLFPMAPCVVSKPEGWLYPPSRGAALSALRYVEAEIIGLKGWYFRIGYCRTILKAGTRLDRSDPIGTAQDVAAAYGWPKERNHVHVEVRCSWKLGALLHPGDLDQPRQQLCMNVEDLTDMTARKRHAVELAAAAQLPPVNPDPVTSREDGAAILRGFKALARVLGKDFNPWTR